jgi:hypothetical protein
MDAQPGRRDLEATPRSGTSAGLLPAAFRTFAGTAGNAKVIEDHPNNAAFRPLTARRGPGRAEVADVAVQAERPAGLSTFLIR